MPAGRAQAYMRMFVTAAAPDNIGHSANNLRKNEKLKITHGRPNILSHDPVQRRPYKANIKTHPSGKLIKKGKM